VCSYKAEARISPGGLPEGAIITIYRQDKQFALMSECQKSGYGVFNYDQEFLPFDKAGSPEGTGLLQTGQARGRLPIGGRGTDSGRFA
jgi:hypothetical protein